jgi:hypothetical protein
LPDELASLLYRELLHRFDGSIVLLDWDNRVPRIYLFRMRHLSEMPGGCSTERLFALMENSDLLIGVDSGPLHAASLTQIPRVGICMPGHYPARYMLPDPRQLNLVLAVPTARWNRFRRVPWNIVEQSGAEWDPAWLAENCLRMLEPSRYLAEDRLSADIMLRHWVEDFCGSSRKDVGAYADRTQSFDRLLREATRRFQSPRFVETGCIRAEEDWAGTGFSTYLFGAYLMHRGGRLDSIDLTSAHCRFARQWCEVFGSTVQVHEQDSVAFLQNRHEPIDVLYLDSLDTYESGHAEHALREAQAAMRCLHDDSLILIDDTEWLDQRFLGKGALAIPWLLENGWRMIFSGYQILLERSRT